MKITRQFDKIEISAYKDIGLIHLDLSQENAFFDGYVFTKEEAIIVATMLLSVANSD
jgi:hypothetical protein